MLTHVGDADKVLLRGTVVTPATIINGEVLVVGTTIACVAASCAGTPGYSTASVVETNGIILPGLIDAHNHVLFDIFDGDDWLPPPNNSYDDHNDWTSDAGYQDVLDAKQYMNGEKYKGGLQSPIDLGCELDKYGEMKAIIAGTTSMQGQHGTDKTCYSSLAHTLSTGSTTNGFGVSDKMQVSALTPPSDATANSVCKNYTSGATAGFIVHLGEGAIGSPAESELMKMSLLPKVPTGTNVPGCLMVDKTTLIHADAFNDAELTQVASFGMDMIASVHVQAVLYGHGTDFSVVTNVPSARAKGINVGIGPDWSLGGSVNMLEEMRFLDMIDNTTWGNALTPQDIVQMATSGNAVALHIDNLTGTLAVGKQADIAVIRGDTANPYDAILAATPDDVELTIVSGKVLYGDPNLVQLGPAAPGCEQVDLCCGPKFACVATTSTANKLNQTYAQIKSILEDGLMNAPAPYNTMLPLAPIEQCGP